jgi:hypothetical protein
MYTIELTTLVVIGTDCTVVVNPTTIDHDNDSPGKIQCSMMRKKRKTSYTVCVYIYMGVDVVEGAGRKAKRMVLQCINGVGSNPVEGRTKI